MKHKALVMLLLGLAAFLGACAAPRSLPAGPTPIPTLIPATQPASSLQSSPTPSFAILSYPASLPAATLGQSLYQTHCAQCHGVDGKGVLPGARNFTDLDYMRGESPAYFYTAVTEGRGQMPSFTDKLTSDERWDVVFYVWRFSTTADNISLGKSIFETNCAACHGADGTGKVLGAADFTDVRLMDGLAPRDLYLIVTQGKGSMPSWQGRLSQNDRWAVIDYLRAFSYDPALPAEVAGVPSPTATSAGAASPTPTGASQPTATAAAAACDPTYLSQSNPFAWGDKAAITAGRAIFDQNCVFCHGKDGSGALAGTPNFTTAQVQSALRANGSEFLCVVAMGRNAMPAWKGTLTIQQMWQVLTFLATLGSK